MKAQPGDIVVRMECGCPAGPVLVRSAVVPGWTCATCGRHGTEGERYKITGRLVDLTHLVDESIVPLGAA